MAHIRGWNEESATVLLTVLVIAAAAMMRIGPQLASWIAQQVGMGAVFATVWTWARIPVAVVLLMLVAALIYYLFPNTNFMRYKVCIALRIPHI